MIEKKEKSGNFEVCTKTHQALVHIKHTITIRQYKYWLIALKLYSDALNNQSFELDSRGFFSISIKEITNFLGYQPEKKEFRLDLAALRCEPIVVNYLEKDGSKGIHEMGFISEFKLTSKIVRIKFPSLIEDILTLKHKELKDMFLFMNWDIFNSFSGKYEAIIYKLCKDYIGVGRTPLFSLEKYREYIGLKRNEYSKTDNLLRRCVKDPVNGINNSELTDIEIDFHFEKKGIKITGLYFTMKNKGNTSLPQQKIESIPAFKKALTYISTEKQIEYLQKYTEKEIECIISRVNSYIEELRSKGERFQTNALYKAAFLNGWGLEILAYEEKIAENKKEIKQSKEEEERKEKRKLNMELDEFFNLPKDERDRRYQIVVDAIAKDRGEHIRKYIGWGMLAMAREPYVFEYYRTIFKKEKK